MEITMDSLLEIAREKTMKNFHFSKKKTTADHK